MSQGAGLRKAVAITLVAAIIIVSAFVVFTYLNGQTPKADYWVLNVTIAESSLSMGRVTPNGTINVPMNQSGITVTATPTGWNGFFWWTFDGNRLENQSETIFIPRQQADTSHTLEATFVAGTPPLLPVFNGNFSLNMTVDAGSFAPYSFVLPSNTVSSQVQGVFSVDSNQTIRVSIMDQQNYAIWRQTVSPQNPEGSNVTKAYDSGVNSTGSFVLNLPEGTYYVVFDNTFDAALPKNVSAYAYYYYIPN